MTELSDVQDEYLEKSEELRMLRRKVEDAREERDRCRDLLEDAEEEFQDLRMRWQECNAEVSELADALTE